MCSVLERLFVVGHLVAQLDEQSIDVIQLLILLVLHGVAVPVAAEIALGLSVAQARIDHSQERLFRRLADRVGHGLERKCGIVLAVLVIFGKWSNASSLHNFLFG